MQEIEAGMLIKDKEKMFSCVAVLDVLADNNVDCELLVYSVMVDTQDSISVGFMPHAKFHDWDRDRPRVISIKKRDFDQWEQLEPDDNNWGSFR